jgi:hypothetical protein
MQVLKSSGYKKAFMLLILLSVFKLSYAQSVVDTRSLLNELVSYEAAAKWPQPAYSEKQASSYDRASIAPGKPGWFANADASQYIRTDTINGRIEKVMFDANGPAAIVRFWLTTFKRHGNLRIYLDNNPTPALTIPTCDLMKSGLDVGPALLTPHSSYETKEKGGSTLYLPIPFAKHCKITFEDQDTDNQPRYYQVNYRKYVKGTTVHTFSLAQLSRLKGLIEEVNHKLLNPDTVLAGSHILHTATIKPNGIMSLTLPQRPHALQMLTIRLKSPVDTLTDQTFISIKFDGKQTVNCNLAGFAGSGKGGKPLQSWYRTVTADGKIYARWVMPYQHSAQITLTNANRQPLEVSISATTQKWKWDKNSLYFHASEKDENNIPVRKTEQDHPIEWSLLKAKGHGVFMGDTYSVYNLMHAWYGEGDQKFWVDHDTFPSEFGTGTEDYYNTSWAPVVIYQTPFANATRADNADSFGQNTFTRTRNLDRIPFTKSLNYTIEMLGWQNGFINASAVTYWYSNQ